MISRVLLVAGLLLLGVWLLWSRALPAGEPRPFQRLVGRRLLAAGIALLFVGAVLRLAVRA